jgi:hypothetical protein
MDFKPKIWIISQRYGLLAKDKDYKPDIYLEQSKPSFLDI